jgi:hypothetical protein
MAEQQEDELRAVATAAEPVFLLSQEMFAVAVGEAEAGPEETRAAALAFVEAHADRIAQQLLELGAALAAAGVATEVAMVVVDGDVAGLGGG